MSMIMSCVFPMCVDSFRIPRLILQLSGCSPVSIFRTWLLALEFGCHLIYPPISFVHWSRSLARGRSPLEAPPWSGAKILLLTSGHVMITGNSATWLTSNIHFSQSLLTWHFFTGSEQGSSAINGRLYWPAKMAG